MDRLLDIPKNTYFMYLYMRDWLRIVLGGKFKMAGRVRKRKYNKLKMANLVDLTMIYLSPLSDLSSGMKGQMSVMTGHSYAPFEID